MKKLVLMSALLFAMLVASAQSGKRDLNNAYNHYSNGYLDKAQAAIERCLQAEDTKNEAKTWMYRGNIYLLIADSKDEVYKNLCNNAAEVAFESYEKALALDPGVSVSMRIPTPAMGLKICSQMLIQKSVDLLRAGTDMEKALELAEKAHVADRSDDNNTYIYAYAAELNGKKDIAKTNYMALVKKRMKGNIYPYVRLANLYKEADDTANAVKVVNIAESMFLTDEKFDVDMASSASLIYMWAGQNEVAADIMNKALAKDPDNHTLLINYGTELTNQKQYTEAEKYLLKAVEMKSDDIYANYNLGNCYYNNYVDIMKNIDDILDDNEYNKAKEFAEGLLAKARPYLEKSHQIDPKDYNTLLMLKLVYSRLNELDKLNEVNEAIKALGR
ncbi:MAG: hypothetical protein J5701_06325 [Bacteroidales bacterium]|nr:hypothetical protein [Bacteroidales bacterium]